MILSNEEMQDWSLGMDFLGWYHERIGTGEAPPSISLEEVGRRWEDFQRHCMVRTKHQLEKHEAEHNQARNAISETSKAMQDDPKVPSFIKDTIREAAQAAASTTCDRCDAQRAQLQPERLERARWFAMGMIQGILFHE